MQIFIASAAPLAINTIRNGYGVVGKMQMNTKPETEYTECPFCINPYKAYNHHVHSNAIVGNCPRCQSDNVQISINQQSYYFEVRTWDIKITCRECRIEINRTFTETKATIAIAKAIAGWRAFPVDIHSEYKKYLAMLEENSEMLKAQYGKL